MLVYIAFIVIYKLVSYRLHARLVQYALAVRAVSPQLRQIGQQYKTDLIERNKQQTAVISNAGIDRGDQHLMTLADGLVCLISWGILAAADLMGGRPFLAIENVAAFSWAAVGLWAASSIAVRFVQHWVMNIDSTENFSLGMGCLLIVLTIPIWIWPIPAYVFFYWVTVNVCTCGLWGWYAALELGSNRVPFPVPGAASTKSQRATASQPPASTPSTKSYSPPPAAPRPQPKPTPPAAPRPVPPATTSGPPPASGAVPTPAAPLMSDTSVPVVNTNTTPGKCFDLQAELNALQVGQTIDFDPPGLIITGPVKFRKNSPVSVDGRGGTIWSGQGPVVSLEQGQVVLSNLTIAVIGKTPGVAATLETALEIKPGAQVTLRNVAVVGRVTGLGTGEDQYRLPGQLDLGSIKPGTQRFKVRLSVGDAVSFTSDLAGLKFTPQQLGPGAHEIDVVLPDLFEGTRLRGTVLLESKLVNRRFDLIGSVAAQGQDLSGKMLWQPADWATLTAPPAKPQPLPKPQPAPVQPTPAPQPTTSRPPVPTPAPPPTPRPTTPQTSAAPPPPAPAAAPPEVPKKRNIVKPGGFDDSVFG